MKAELNSWAASAAAYTSDSRDKRSGLIFVALKGEKNDGHDFVQPLLANQNFRGFVVERGSFESKRALWLKERPEADFWICESSQLAHRELAASFRARFQGKVFAIGGSSGKTSCKEFLSQILKATGKKVVATYKSQNGELGIPKTLESLDPSVDIAVIEIGIDGPGDMIRHAQLVQPDVALLTSIGEEHLNLLKNLEGVFREEKILFEVTLKRGGKCFAPVADAWLKKIANVTFTPDSPEKVDPAFQCNLDGIFALRNAALAATAALYAFPGEKQNIARALKSLEIPEGRGRRMKDARGHFWIEDHYNSNPSSLRAALLQMEVLRKENPGRSINLVLGDMLDLGDQAQDLHSDILPAILALKPERVVLIGPLMSQLVGEIAKSGSETEVYTSSNEASAAAQFSKWVPCINLFKGSRGMALEKVIIAFQNQLQK